MAARRIARILGVSFDESPPVWMIRGAEGTWGEGVRVRGSSAPFPPWWSGCGMFREQIADGHRLVAGWAEAAHADAPAELPAVAAILITEVPVLALWALIHGRLARCVRWYGWKRSRMSTPPGSLTVSWRAKALTPNRLERSATQRAADRLAIVTQRRLRRHGQPRWRGDRVAARPCQPSLGPI
jgi:hypothetical protein